MTRKELIEAIQEMEQIVREDLEAVEGLTAEELDMYDEESDLTLREAIQSSIDALEHYRRSLGFVTA